MKTETINLIKTKSKKVNESIFESEDYKNYITNAKTLNLYIDQLANYIQQFLTKKNTDYKNIGQVFFGLMLYVFNPYITDKELKQELQASTETIDKVKELIEIYNNTMLKNYIKATNGQKGGAPKGNKNASKRE